MQEVNVAFEAAVAHLTAPAAAVAADAVRTSQRGVILRPAPPPRNGVVGCARSGSYLATGCRPRLAVVHHPRPPGGAYEALPSSPRGCRGGRLTIRPTSSRSASTSRCPAGAVSSSPTPGPRRSASPSSFASLERRTRAYRVANHALAPHESRPGDRTRTCGFRPQPRYWALRGPRRTVICGRPGCPRLRPSPTGRQPSARRSRMAWPRPVGGTRQASRPRVVGATQRRRRAHGRRPPRSAVPSSTVRPHASRSTASRRRRPTADEASSTRQRGCATSRRTSRGHGSAPTRRRVRREQHGDPSSGMPPGRITCGGVDGAVDDRALHPDRARPPSRITSTDGPEVVRPRAPPWSAAAEAVGRRRGATPPPKRGRAGRVSSGWAGARAARRVPRPPVTMSSTRAAREHPRQRAGPARRRLCRRPAARRLPRPLAGPHPTTDDGIRRSAFDLQHPPHRGRLDRWPPRPLDRLGWGWRRGPPTAGRGRRSWTMARPTAQPLGVAKWLVRLASSPSQFASRVWRSRCRR